MEQLLHEEGGQNKKITEERNLQIVWCCKLEERRDFDTPKKT